MNKRNKKGQFAKGHTGWNKGKPRSEETKRKISKANKGQIPWMKGKKHTVEARKKISEAHKGMRPSEETRKKLSEVHKGEHPKSYYQKIGIMGYKKLLQSKSPTGIEVKLYNELKRRGLLFETQKLINGKFVVDAYIPSLNLVIEADGDYWHSLEENIKRDKSRNAYLRACGFNLLRLTETEINNGEFRKRLP